MNHYAIKPSHCQILWRKSGSGKFPSQRTTNRETCRCFMFSLLSAWKSCWEHSSYRGFKTPLKLCVVMTLCCFGVKNHHQLYPDHSATWYVPCNITAASRYIMGDVKIDNDTQTSAECCSGLLFQKAAKNLTAKNSRNPDAARVEFHMTKIWQKQSSQPWAWRLKISYLSNPGNKQKNIHFTNMVSVLLLCRHWQHQGSHIDSF